MQIETNAAGTGALERNADLKQKPRPRLTKKKIFFQGYLICREYDPNDSIFQMS